MRTTILTRVVTGLTLTAAAVLVTAPVARAALTPEQQCQKGRYDAAANYAQCQNKTMGQFFAGGDPGKLELALSKCRVKYTDTWGKLQKKASGTGSTCDADRFVDNNFGGVIDNLTGLQWEKKTDAGDLHDKDNVYTWHIASLSFLAGNSTSGGLNRTACFENSCDWRLPTRAELQTILSEPFPCTTAPCIEAVFGPTIANFYWSSTTDAIAGGLAWVVHFGSGQVSNANQLDNWSVRAVRGGL